MTTPRFLVKTETLGDTTTELTGAELRHLRVRRLRIGSPLVLFDGFGRARPGVVSALDRTRAVIRLDAEPKSADTSPVALTLAQGVLKHDRFDLVIEKATELGVAEVLAFTSSRTVARPSQNRRQRWERLARSAAKQSQRRDVPRVDGPLSFDHVLQRTEAMRILFWEGTFTEEIGALHRGRSHVSRILAVVGPEGGFTDTEVRSARDAGFHIVGLGPRVLRAETAGIVATALCQFLWGDFCPPRV